MYKSIKMTTTPLGYAIMTKTPFEMKRIILNSSLSRLEQPNDADNLRETELQKIQLRKN